MTNNKHKMCTIFKHILSIILIMLVINLNINAQNLSKYKGLPFIKNYTTEAYNAHEQNFDIVQDKDGIMYFANFAGILQFDGTKWVKISTSSGMRVLSLDIDLEGRVYAGGLMDFGYIRHLKTGESKFVSLADPNDKDMGMIFKVLCDNEKTYFISSDAMYIYKDSVIKKIKFENKVLSAFLVPLNKKNELFIFFERDLRDITKTQNGLCLYSNNTFLPIKDKSSAQIVDVQTILEYTDNKSLILGTASQGMFILRNNEINDFDTNSNRFLKEKGHTCGTKISNSSFALGTFTGGIIIMDNKGNTTHIIDKNSLLQDQSVNALFLDQEKSLWAATNNGISKIEVNWNLSYINNLTSGLEGKVQDIIEFNKTIYFATDNGLFYLDDSSVQKIRGIDFAVWDMDIINNTLVTATTKGIFLITENNVLSTDYTDFSFCITQASLDKNRFYTGNNGRIDIFSLNNNKIQKERSIKTATGDVYKILENENDLYAEISPGKIFKYSLNSNEGVEMLSDTKFISLHLNQKGERIFFSSEKGLFYFNTNSKKVEKFNLFENDTSSHNLWLDDLYELPDRNFILTDGEQKNISFITLGKDKYTLFQTPLNPIANFSIDKMYYSPSTSVIWLGGKDGLILFNYKETVTFKSPFKTLIRSVISLHNDSLINQDEDETIKLNFSENSLRFEFSAPVFVSKGKVFYRYILSGFDKDTSDWTELTYKDYTNIPDGKYTFSVEARNEFGQLLNQSEFKFQVLIPMYRRWWAFIIYVLTLVAVIRIYMSWRMKSVEKEREVLENTVKERTEEIAQSKEEIETQRDELYKQKQEIVDSINYAQRIQEAVLPSQELMNEVLTDHFVFYKPRDIVSGDFYWLRKIKNFSFAVVADCTGHGVPGAFMSMLGSSFLNEIVTTRTLDSAGNILNRLRNKVKNSLHQSGVEGEQKDGMDISLLIIDWETLELQFAGAYNSLYIVRKDPDSSDTDEAKYIIDRLKADRQPIGIYLHEKDFTNHSYQLKEGDTIYALSDGYVDQFGGDTGGKFKSVRFTNMLLSFQDKTMEEQKIIMGRTFNKWKRDIDQVDDVLVMGIRI